MERKPLTAQPSTLLAAIPDKGLIRTCPGGCIHVTFGPVTLDFPCRVTFDQFAETVARHETTGGAVQLRYYHALLRFRAEEFRELAAMVAEAARQLRELDVVRRLLSGPPAL